MNVWVAPAPRAKKLKWVTVPAAGAVTKDPNSVVPVEYTDVNPVEVSPSCAMAGPDWITVLSFDALVNVPDAFDAVTWNRNVGRRLPTSDGTLRWSRRR